LLARTGIVDRLDETGRLWRERYDELTARDSPSLEADDLELLAEAAFWLGRPRDTIAARQRAYAAYRDANQHEHAAQISWKLFHNHFELDETAAASGWLNRAQRHILEVPDSIERGYVAIAAAMWAGYSGKLELRLRWRMSSGRPMVIATWLHGGSPCGEAC
jgi:hypothetical protein